MLYWVSRRLWWVAFSFCGLAQQRCCASLCFQYASCIAGPGG